MRTLGLSASDQRRFIAGLAGSYAMRHRARILDLNENPVVNVTAALLDGQVDVQARSDVQRSATVRLFDPDGAIGLDSESPWGGSAAWRYLLHIDRDHVFPDGWTVEAPIFHGPLVGRLTRDYRIGVIEVSAQGLEALGRRPVWRGRTWARGTRKRAIIRELLEGCGFRVFSMPDDNDRLAERLTVQRKDLAWSSARKLAESMDLRLYVDGGGVCRLDHYPRRPVLRFRDGDGGLVTRLPERSDLLGEFANVVHFKGAKPRKGKAGDKRDPVTYTAYAKPTHPLSRESLAFHGRLAEVVDWIEDGQVGKRSKARDIAERALRDRLNGAVSVDLNWGSAPVPHLDPHDMVRVDTEEVSTNIRLLNWTLPIPGEGQTDVEMSCGVNRHVSPRRRVRGW